jgi:ferredoxin-NADP reductase
VPYVADKTNGFLDAAKIETIAGQLQDAHIFICGPPVMMQSLRTQLLARGVPKSHIHSEEFTML